jgi:hypothetical protein
MLARHLAPWLFLALVSACASNGDDGASAEDALATCTPPNPGPLNPAARWVRPGGFVNVDIGGDATVDLRVEKLNGAAGTATSRKFGIGGKPSFVVEFDNASKGFFRLVASRKGKDLGEVHIRVSDAVPRLSLGSAGADGKIDPVAQINGTQVALAGQIADELGSPATVKIGGAAQSVSGGKFSLSMPADPGLHLVDAEVVDVACNSYPVTGAFVAAISRGGDAHLRVRASQPAVDAIAAIVSQHFAEVVKVPADPNPVANALGQSLFLDGVDFPSDPGSVHLKLTVQNGGFGVHLAVDGQLVARARLNSIPTDVKVNNFVLDGTVTIGNDGHFGLSVSHVDGQVSADVANFPVPLLGLFQPVIHKAVAVGVSTFAPKFIEKALAGQNGDIPFALPWASAKPAIIHYTLGGIGSSTAGFTADVHTSVANSPQFLKVTDTPAPGDGEIALGLSYATVNQTLYSLWSKGDFNPPLSNADVIKFETGAGLPTFAKDAQIDVAVDNPQVPPVVLPSPDGKLVHVGVGPLPLHIFVQGSGLSTKLEADVAVNADFRISGQGSDVRVDLVKADPHARITGRIDVNASLDDVTNFTKDLSVRLAKALATNSITMQIPAFDLSSTGVAALSGTQVTVSNIGVTAGPAGLGLRGTANIAPPK